MSQNLKRALFFFANSRLFFLIAVVAALSMPSLGPAQAVSGLIDLKTTTSGTNETDNNFIKPSGKYTCVASGGAVVKDIVISVELEWFDVQAGKFQRFDPPLVYVIDELNQGNDVAWAPKDSAYWNQISSGFQYRVTATMVYDADIGAGFETRMAKASITKTFP